MRIFSLVLLVLVLTVSAITKSQFSQQLDFSAFTPVSSKKLKFHFNPLNIARNLDFESLRSNQKTSDFASYTHVASTNGWYYAPIPASNQWQSPLPSTYSVMEDYNCCCGCDWNPPCCCCDDCCCDNPCYPYGKFYEIIPSFLYRGGSGRSYRNGYGTLALFLAEYDCSCKSYPFLDLRVHRVGDHKFASNVGIGWRQFSCDYWQMFGINAYYDYRKIHRSHLHQVGLGLELLGNCWDFRANAYVPVGNKQPLIETNVYNYPGGFVAISEKHSFALWCVDFELGKTIHCGRCFNIYAAAGPYFYGRNPFGGNIIGGMGRVEAALCRYLTARLYVTYDCLFKTKVQGEVYLAFPLCCRKCWDCLFMRVERNDIITKRDACCWTSNF